MWIRDSTSFVIIVGDLIGLDLPLATEIREAVGQRLGTSTGCVALGCTHTHNGPSTSRGNLGGVHEVGGDPAERLALDAYIANLKDQLVEVAAAAMKADSSLCRPGRREMLARGGDPRILTTSWRRSSTPSSMMLARSR